jgi:hypothetical protein
MRELEQAIDGFQVLDATTKWIHAHRKTRPKNKLKFATEAGAMAALDFSAAWRLKSGAMSDNAALVMRMSQTVSRA